MTTIERAEIIGKLRETIRFQKERNQQIANDHIQRAQEADGIMQSRYDRTKEYESMMANAIMINIAEAEEALKLLETLPLLSVSEEVAVGSIVELLDQNETESEWFVITPAKGGVTIEIDGRKIVSLNSSSDLGRALIGKKEGQKAKFVIAEEPQSFKIITVL